MRTQSARLLVGIFALLGIALIIALLLALGTGRVFRDRTLAVVYFDESVNGLSVGANVKYQGFVVGEVVQMNIAWAGLERDGEVPIEVIFDLEARWAPEGGWDVEELVGRGLRAQLELESLLTNIRFVELAFHPDAEERRVAGNAAVEHPEVPAIPSDFEVLQARTTALLEELGEVDYQAVAQSVSRLADQVRAFVADPIDIGEVVDPQGTLGRQLQGVLGEIERAARSVRQLADQLSRDPGAILRGGSQ
jgi:paraquat-inducible protein B